MKILVVDNEVEIVAMLKRFLELKGHTADVAFDGMTGMDMIKTNNYGLAILDQNMPELTGLEIASYIKKNLIPTRTLILTGYPEIDENFSKLVGADDFLQKPVDLDRIEEIIKKYE